MLDDNLPCQVARTQKGQLTEKNHRAGGTSVYFELKIFSFIPEALGKCHFTLLSHPL